MKAFVKFLILNVGNLKKYIQLSLDPFSPNFIFLSYAVAYSTKIN